MKADARFTVYSAPSRAAIGDVIAQHIGGEVNLGRVFDRLEREARFYLDISEYSKDWSTPTERQKSRVQLRRQLAAFRRRLTDADVLIWGDQYDRASAALSVVNEILTEKDPEPLESRSATNAGKPRRDAYFENLIELWCEIGGARENKKPLQAFVQVASAPFIGPTRAETICKILRRLLEKRGASTLR